MSTFKIGVSGFQSLLLTKLFIVMVLVLSNHSVVANDSQEIKTLLQSNSAPTGVIFELIGSEDSQYLPNALAKIENYKELLSQKYPSIKIAVVSHGAEQFELTKNNINKEQKSHNAVKRITADDVPVHICATHASWRGVSAEDFPNYISVTARAPAQIKAYQNLGYQLIIVD